MKSFRILYVDESVLPSYGGTKRVLTNLFTAIDKTRWDAHVLYYRNGPYVRDAEDLGVVAIAADELALSEMARAEKHQVAAQLRGIGVRRTIEGDIVRTPGRRLVYDIRSLMKFFVADRHRSQALHRFVPEHVDLIHFNGSMHRNYEWAHVAAELGVPFVTHEHGVWRRPPVAFRQVARRAAAVICLTEERVSQVREFCRGRVQVALVPNGMPMAQMVTKRARASVRLEFGVGPETPLLVTAGHFQPWKGQLLAVEAARLLAARGVNFRWLLCGAHLAGDYVHEIRHRIETCGLESTFILLEERSDLPDIFGAADLAVHTSIMPEPFGMVVTEAMAMGTPVVGPREGALPTLVRDGEDGLLYTPRDPVSMADKIMLLLESPTERTLMGEKAATRARHEFDVTLQASKICALYERALEERSRS